MTVDDVLSRRVPLLLVGRDQGLDVLEAVADRLAAQLGWDEAKRGASSRSTGRRSSEAAGSKRDSLSP